MIRRETTYMEIRPDADTMASWGAWCCWTSAPTGAVTAMAARSTVDAWLQNHTEIDHLRIEDGRGRHLGRTYRVKLWPTVILLRDGHEFARVMRPRDARDLWPLEEVVG